MKIMDLPRVDRPREKLEKYGPEKLSNSELLAILLGTGTKGVNVIELVDHVIVAHERFNSMREQNLLN